MDLKKQLKGKKVLKLIELKKIINLYIILAATILF